MKKYNLNNLSLREKQSVFVLMIEDLIHHAYQKGYEMTFGDAYIKTGHMENSNHYIRLAMDLNLFKNGVWLKDGTGHDKLHDYWDRLGGAERIKGDLNHYSVLHEGRR